MTRSERLRRERLRNAAIGAGVFGVMFFMLDWAGGWFFLVPIGENGGCG